jgi:hypothetical protein
LNDFPLYVQPDGSGGCTIYLSGKRPRPGFMRSASMLHTIAAMGAMYGGGPLPRTDDAGEFKHPLSSHYRVDPPKQKPRREPIPVKQLSPLERKARQKLLQKVKGKKR